MLPPLSKYAQKEKIEYFIKDIPKESKILEVGCGRGSLGNYLKKNGWINYIGLDVVQPADIVGDIRSWRDLGIEGQSFDVIIAFEVVEHVDCFQEFFNILKPGGLLMLTSPLPHMDWLCRLLEIIGLNTKRTSPHSNLIDFKKVSLFDLLEIKIVGLISQWGKFRKPI